MFSTPALLEKVEDLLAKARVRGVVDVGLRAPRHGEWRRSRPAVPLDFIVGDRARIALHLSLLSSRGRLSGLLVADEEIASAAARYFERVWETAEQAGEQAPKEIR